MPPLPTDEELIIDTARTVADIGEFALIERVTADLVPNSQTELGPGDDAAVVRTLDGRTVATTDMLVEGVHFRRDWSAAEDVGHKAAAKNLADIAAMGARPVALLVALGVPGELDVDWTDGLLIGLRQECAGMDVAIVGGDVVRSEKIVLGVAAIRCCCPGPAPATEWPSPDGWAGPRQVRRCWPVASVRRSRWWLPTGVPSRRTRRAWKRLKRALPR